MINVSIIVPVYKTPLEYLRACFNSLIAQTMRECEFIVVSDGAPEAECSVCEEYASKDNRFKFFKQEHAGVSATRNYGIEQAQGEYITFVDADDWIEPETCEDTYQFAKENNSDLVFWDLYLEQSKQRTKTEYSTHSINLLTGEDILDFQKNIIYSPQKELLTPNLTVCKLTKKNIIKSNSIFFDESLVLGEDRVFNFQISNVANRISYYKKNLYHYLIFQTSTVHSFFHREFSKHLKYILALKSLSCEEMESSLANETVKSFFYCINKINTSKLSMSQQREEFLFLKKQIRSKNFHSLIQKAAFPNYSLIAKREIALMKRGCTFFSTLRVIKVSLANFFSSSH